MNVVGRGQGRWSNAIQQDDDDDDDRRNLGLVNIDVVDA